MLALFKKYRFFLFLSTIFIFLRLPSLFEPYWYGDEGIYLVLGQAIRKGWLLYQQIHDNKPPTLYYLAALGKTVFGFRFLLSVAMTGSIYFFHQIAKKLLSKKLPNLATVLFTILVSIPVIEGNIANAEVFMLLPTLYAIYLFFCRPITNYRLLIIGLSLGLAFTIKVPVAIEFVFICLVVTFSVFTVSRSKIITQSTKVFWQLVLLGVGFILPTVFYSIYFYLKGAFSEFIFAALLQNFGYLSSWSTGTHSGSATSGGLTTRAILLIVTWAIIYILRLKQLINDKTFFISAWFSSTIFGALLSTRPYPHYLIQIAPPFILSLVVIFDKNYQKLSKYIMVGGIVFLGYIILHFHFYFYPTFSYYKNFYGHLTNLTSAQYRNFFGNRVSSLYQISDFVANNTTADDKIFIWGDEPYIYALANRLPVGRFTVAYHIVDFGQHQATYNQLITDFPKLIITFPMDNRPFPEFDRYLGLYYAPAYAFGDATIYLLRN